MPSATSSAAPIAGVDTVWDISGSQIALLILANVLNLLIGFMLGVLIRNSPGAIVGYFVYSLRAADAVDGAGQVPGWWVDARQWVDFNWAQGELYDGSLTSEQWAQLGGVRPDLAGHPPDRRPGAGDAVRGEVATSTYVERPPAGTAPEACRTRHSTSGRMSGARSAGPPHASGRATTSSRTRDGATKSPGRRAPRRGDELNADSASASLPRLRGSSHGPTELTFRPVLRAGQDLGSDDLSFLRPAKQASSSGDTHSMGIRTEMTTAPRRAPLRRLAAAALATLCLIGPAIVVLASTTAR